MLLIVYLTPKASSTKIEGWTIDTKGQTVLRVKVTAIPEGGKANEALVKLLSAAFKIAKSRISLVRGETSRTKYLEIEGLSEQVLKEILPPPLFSFSTLWG